MPKTNYSQEIENDELPEFRIAIVFARSKQAAIDDRLLHFPRAELIEAEVLTPARKGHLGRYYLEVSEDLD